ncbi:MAG TPA: energy transducer TonB [Acidobacteriaceae bacterium]|jgi:protein TonB|nr:energy transducer TonB [Acidobacteriaceae bacterium]
MMLQEEGLFASMLSSLRDVFFPVKLPPLVLESKPIPVIDRMATKQNPKATAAAITFYVLIILLCAWVVKMKLQQMATQKMEQTQITLPPAPDLGKMGGGGGQKGLTAVTKGKMPKVADLQKPKLTMPDPTVNVQKDLKMTDNNMPNFGDPNSPLLGNSMGRGSGTGMGNGNGSGIGSGSGGGMGGGVRQVGGGVKGPVIIYQPEPEFSEEARKAKFMGVVTVSLIVGADGKPQQVHVTRGVGMGLDDNAVAAVKQYRFKPATENGKPVAVYLNVEVNFEIF